jgi:segregation and condensation protein B
MNNPLIPRLEALLFIHGEPLPLKKAAKVLAASKEELQTALFDLREALAKEDRGLVLISDASLEAIFGDKDFGEHEVQLATKPEFGKIMEEFVKSELEEDLTPAALEALSLIIYLGPVSRGRIDYLRGVNSSFIVRSLLLRGLVERFPDPQRPHIYVYRATLDALKHLGVASPEELPEYAKFRELTAMGLEARGEEKKTEPPSDGEG